MKNVRKKGNRWYYRVAIEVDGKKKIIERAGGKTELECQMTLLSVLSDMKKGKEPSPEGCVTVSQLSKEWQDHYVCNLAENTQISYESMLKNHILPVFGNRKITTIKPIELQKFFESKREYSRRTLEIIRATLHCMFSYAVSPCGYIHSNPVHNLRLPKTAREVPDIKVWSKSDLKAIFDRFGEDHDYWLPLMIMYHTGCRIGETLALHWDDIDLHNNTMYIHATMMDSGVISSRTKTASSTRRIPFSKKLHDILVRVQKKQSELSKEIGREFKLVCCRNDTRRISPANMRFFNMWCRDTFGYGSLHFFRHTHCSMLLDAGESLEMVSKRLGHNSISTTSKIYSHILEDRNRKMIKSLDLL